MMLLPLMLLTSSLLQLTSSHWLLTDLQRHAEKGKILMADVILSTLNASTTCLGKKGDLYVDDVVCLRILQAYVKGVKRPWARNPAMESINKKMKKFSKKLSVLLRRSISHLKQALSGKRNVLHRAMQTNFWKVPQVLTHTNGTEIPTALPSLDFMKGNTTQECIKRLLENRVNTESCTYSDTCRYIMTMPVFSYFQTTYQLIYFLFSKMIGCSNGMFEKTEDYMNVFCSNLMSVNAEIESRKYQSSYHYIFLENIILCGTAGFIDFYKPHWLVNILQWQKEDGCFSTASLLVSAPSQMASSMPWKSTRKHADIHPVCFISDKVKSS